MRLRVVLPVVAVATLAVALVADAVVPPAKAHQPATIYVDRRIGEDHQDGRTPETALETLQAALERAGPDTRILLMGYGLQLVYAGTETSCVTLRGAPGKPVQIKRNAFTNTPNPAVLTATRRVDSEWKKVGRDTWRTPWPDPIRLFGDADSGFLKMGGIAITGYAKPPPRKVERAAWWASGHLYLRDDHYVPNHFTVYVKNGDGLCISGRSRHVRIDDLSVSGAVHAVRVEPGAVDVKVTHMVRRSVLDKDLRGDK